jgi:hypothetical protein
MADEDEGSRSGYQNRENDRRKGKRIQQPYTSCDAVDDQKTREGYISLAMCEHMQDSQGDLREV